MRERGARRLQANNYASLLETDAVMKSIVRRDTGEDWQAYLERLMREDGVITENEEPADDEIRRFDRRRKDKKVSNEEWVSPTDPSAKITPATHGDSQTLVADV